MTKPTGSLHWADSPTTLRTEPAEATKSTGLAVNAKLAAQYFNYIAGVCGDWITWLNTRIFDAYTIPSMGADCRLIGDPDEGLRIRDAAGDRLPVTASSAILNGEVVISSDSLVCQILGIDGVTPADLKCANLETTAIALDADCLSCISIPLGSGFSQSWTQVAETADCNSDHWTSPAIASAPLAFICSLPYGTLLNEIVIDWLSTGHMSGDDLYMSAWLVVSTPANGTPSVGYALKSTGSNKVSLTTGQSRQRTTFTPDQYRSFYNLDNDTTCYLRVLICSNGLGSAGDMVHGVYVKFSHRSSGHLSPAPILAP